MDAGRRVRHAEAFEDPLESFVGLTLLRYMKHLERPRVERLEVLRRPEPGMTKSDHGPPVDVDRGDDQDGNEVGDDDVGVEKVAFDISDGEHAEKVPFLPFDILEVVDHIDRDENSTCEDNYA